MKNKKNSEFCVQVMRLEGDLDTVDSLLANHDQFKDELNSHEQSFAQLVRRAQDWFNIKISKPWYAC